MTQVLSAREAQEKYQALMRRDRAIRDQHAKYEAQLNAQLAERDRLLALAREQFGTDDVAELRSRYRKSLESDTRALADWEASLNETEGALNRLNQAPAGRLVG